MTTRQEYPPKLTAIQLGPTEKNGLCAYAPTRGCGLEPARFYIGGWRCERHAPGAISNFPPTAGVER